MAEIAIDQRALVQSVDRRGVRALVLYKSPKFNFTQFSHTTIFGVPTHTCNATPLSHYRASYKETCSSEKKLSEKLSNPKCLTAGHCL